MRESSIQTQIIDWLREQGCYVVNIHGHPFQEKGVPDILFCFQGRFGAIEVKIPGEKPTTIQQHHLDSIGRAGGWAMCAHSLEEAQAALPGVV